MKNSSGVLGLDIGTKRIGAAVVEQGIVFPLQIIPRVKLFKEIQKIVRLRKIHTIVIGIPKGEYSGKTPLQKIQGIITHIQNLFPEINIVEEDERYTTKIAQYILEEQNIDGYRDDIAALIILESYLKKHK